MFTVALFLLYPIAIQYERGGIWQVLAPVVIVTAIVDLVANYTELALLTLDFPQRGEFLFSQRAQRLCRRDDWRGKFAVLVALYCNLFDPQGDHIITGYK